ncbi:hypothetical protein UlMin_012772 [Ulmus minor]
MEEVVAFEGELEQKDKLWSSKSPYSRKLVPWLSWDEWLFVYDSLFSDSSQSVAAALTRISTWQSRGCLPVAIEVTALIIDIQQSDPHLRKDLANDPSNKNPAKQCTNLSISEEKLAMLYSMTIMRLVNGLIEKTRDKKKSSIAAAAKEIGMPRKLIDIRHEVSHREIPALQIVRDASAEALDWLKFFYWEPQKKAVPFHGREEIKSKLHELTLCLKAKLSCPSVSSPLKAKCSRNHELLFGRNKFLSVAAGKLHSSKSGGDKKQTKKVLKNLLGMYSSCSSEFVSVLLDFLLIALNSLDLVELPADSQVGTNIDSLLNQRKLVIKRLSHKEPELLVSLLEEVLHTIETQETMKYEIGKHLISSEKSPGVFRVELLSSLFAWLVTNLKDFMPKLHKDSDPETKVPTAETSLSKAILVQLLQKCLVLSASGNKQLMISAIHIAQLIGDNHLMGKLNKLSVLVSANSDILEDDSSINLKNLLIQQDESISQAAKKLELLKHRRLKSKVTNSTDVVMGKSNRWVVATSWNRCPLGMLPSFFGSSGRLPVLDCEDDQNKIPETSRAKENRESNCNGKRIEADSNVQQVDNSSAKKRKVTVEEEECKANSEAIGSVIGHLMINGAWKKVGEEELLAIKSSIRILV